MGEYTIERLSGRLPAKLVRPPGNNSPQLSKEVRIANWLSAPLFSFDNFPQYLLSKDRGCWGKLSRVTGVFFNFLQERLKKSHINKKFTFPDKIITLHRKLTFKTWQQITLEAIPANRYCGPQISKKIFSSSSVPYHFYQTFDIRYCRSPPFLKFELVKIQKKRRTAIWESADVTVYIRRRVRGCRIIKATY